MNRTKICIPIVEKTKESIIDKAKMANNTGVKIVMDTEPGDNLSSDSYAYEGEVDAFVSDIRRMRHVI